MSSVSIVDCCLGKSSSIDCPAIREANNCGLLPEVKDACTTSLRATVGRQPDALGFYAGLAIQGNTNLVTKVSSKAECKKVCDDSQYCRAVEIVPVSGGGAGAYNCLRHDLANPTLIVSSTPGIETMIKGNQVSRCESICTSDPTADRPTPPWCQDLYSQLCSNNVDHPYCKRFCSIRGVNCDADIKKYCDRLGIDRAKNDELCACFLPPAFYSAYYKDVKDKATIGTTLASYDLPCAYPACQTSSVKPYLFKQGSSGTSGGYCPNVFKCVSAPQVSSTGQIIGDITILPRGTDGTVDCTGVTKMGPSPTPTPPSPPSPSPPTPTPTPTPSPPTPGPSPSPTPTPTPTPTPVPPGPTPSPTPTTTGGWSGWAIAGIILAALLLIGLIVGLLVANRKKAPTSNVKIVKPSTATQVRPSLTIPVVTPGMNGYDRWSG